jgi:hypothetical protein
LRLREKLFWLCVGAVLIVLFLSLIPSHYPICEEAEKTQAKDCPSYQVAQFLWIKIPQFLDAHNWLVTALFAGLVTLFTWRLWQATNQLKISTDNLWEAADRTLKITERAFVYLDGFNFELTTAADRPLNPDLIPERYKDDPGLFLTRFAAQPRWKNGGTTPTKNLTIQIDWRGAGIPMQSTYTYREKPRPFFLAPQATQCGDYIDMPGGQALIAWAGNPVGESPMMFVWGRADYEDVFKRPHFVEWCYQVRFSRHIRSERLRAEFIQWGEYNRTDDG